MAVKIGLKEHKLTVTKNNLLRGEFGLKARQSKRKIEKTA